MGTLNWATKDGFELQYSASTIWAPFFGPGPVCYLEPCPCRARTPRGIRHRQQRRPIDSRARIQFDNLPGAKRSYKLAWRNTRCPRLCQTLLFFFFAYGACSAVPSPNGSTTHSPVARASPAAPRPNWHVTPRAPGASHSNALATPRARPWALHPDGCGPPPTRKCSAANLLRPKRLSRSPRLPPKLVPIQCTIARSGTIQRQTVEPSSEQNSPASAYPI